MEKFDHKTLKKFKFFEILVKNSYNLTKNDTILTKFGQWKSIPMSDKVTKKIDWFFKNFENFGPK